MLPLSSSQGSGSPICFTDRHEAGEHLAQAVLDTITRHFAQDIPRCVVYALPKGGLPIAKPVARLLGCPLDLVVAKKITRPDNTELAIGAVTADGHVVWATPGRSRNVAPVESRISRELPQPANSQFTTALQRAQAHAQAQLIELSASSPRFSPQGAIAIVVDDGIATGMTMAVAVEALRAQDPAQIWICAPVAPPDLIPFLESISDRVVVLATPHPFFSVSRFYKEFPQVSTEAAAIYLQEQNN